MKRDAIDFSTVPPHQWKIHDRLENWARWCRGSSGERARYERSSPMFALYRASEARRADYGSLTSIPVDKIDAQAIAKGVAVLPDKHRRSIQWLYLYGGRDPRRSAWTLGLSTQGLANMVKDARQMLVNRGV